MLDGPNAELPGAVPRIPASAGALVHDRRGRLLILKPTYKRGWTIPGGQIDAGGESPWEACRREAFEECGLRLERGRLVCVDFRRPGPRRPGGIRLLFDCGVLSDAELAGIVLQAEEIEAHRLVDEAGARSLLRGPIRRRVLAVAGRDRCVYLEDGRPVGAVG